MYIKSIDLKNFRNYKDQHIEFNPYVNIFLGENAQGKTNILEAVYVSLLGKSFRTSKYENMINHEEEYFNIKALLEKDYDTFDINYTYSRREKRKVKINRKEIKKISELFNLTKVVVFSPEDLRIVKDEPEKRRKFIDMELSKLRPSYFEDLVNYKKILKQRNSYLKEKNIEREVLDIWDTQLSLFGTDIIRKREKFIALLEEKCSEINSHITGGKEKIRIEYESDIPLADNVMDQKEEFERVISKSREKDIYMGTTSRGPHKDDIRIFSNDIDVRQYGSQGQQRTVALSLKLSEIELIKQETGESGILLLDDVLSELDESRQKYLVNVFEDTQIFITSTSIPDAIMDNISEHKICYIEKGNISEKQ